MAKIYANLIEKGLKTLDQVPERIRKDVRKILDERGVPYETDTTV